MESGSNGVDAVDAVDEKREEVLPCAEDEADGGFVNVRVEECRIRSGGVVRGRERECARSGTNILWMKTPTSSPTYPTNSSVRLDGSTNDLYLTRALLFPNSCPDRPKSDISTLGAPAILLT